MGARRRPDRGAGRQPAQHRYLPEAELPANLLALTADFAAAARGRAGAGGDADCRLRATLRRLHEVFGQACRPCCGRAAGL